MLHAHQQFGAAAVAATGGVRNVKSAVSSSRQQSTRLVSGLKSFSSSSGSAQKRTDLSLDHDMGTSADTKTKDHLTSSSSVTSSTENKSASASTPAALMAGNSTATTAKSNSSSSVSEKGHSKTPPSAMGPASDDDIIIHVCDEARKVNRDFTCSKKLLLEEMKYFESYLSSSNQYDDIDISVHCDVYIFEWLMRFINQPKNPPELNCKSAVSILISSEFLRMQRLVDQCLQFVHDHINEVIKLPIDLNCINSGLVTRLASLFTVSELEKIEDRRDKLRGKLWMKRVESLLEKPGNVLVCCKECGKVYCRRLENSLTCSRAKPCIDFHGNIFSRHVPMSASKWKMRQYIHTMRSQRKMTWDALYWRLWGMFHIFHCTLCGDTFPGCEYNHCVFHPETAKYGAGQNHGTYPCCGKVALRFDTAMRKSGCKARSHTVATCLSQSIHGAGHSQMTSPPESDGFGVGKGIVGVGISVPGILRKADESSLKNDTTDGQMNMLIAHLDLVAIPFVSESSSGGYEDDRAAGLINGGLGGNSEKQDTRSSSKGGGRRKSASSSKSSNRSGGGNTSYGSSSTPRRPGSSKGGRQGRPSTATGGRGSSSLNANRYSSLKNSGADAFTNGVIGYNAKSIGPNHMGQAGGISMSMAGKAVTTPEAFRVNPQRRSMWKLDLQREEDVVRMQALLQKLEKMRAPAEVDEYAW